MFRTKYKIHIGDNEFIVYNNSIKFFAHLIFSLESDPKSLGSVQIMNISDNGIITLKINMTDYLKNKINSDRHNMFLALDAARPRSLAGGFKSLRCRRRLYWYYHRWNIIDKNGEKTSRHNWSLMPNTDYPMLNIDLDTYTIDISNFLNYKNNVKRVCSPTSDFYKVFFENRIKIKPVLVDALWQNLFTHCRAGGRVFKVECEETNITVNWKD